MDCLNPSEKPNPAVLCGCDECMPVDPKDPFSESVAERRERGFTCDEIAANVSSHAMCQGCHCIFARGSITDGKGFCPICHSYNFSYDEHLILKQVNFLRGRPQQVILPRHMLPGGRHL